MTDKTDNFVFVGFWERVLAFLIDGVIALPLGLITALIMKWSVVHRNILPIILSSVVCTIAYLWLVVRFGGSPGKLIIQARIIAADGHFLSWGRAFRRLLPGLLMSLNLLLLIGIAVSRYPDSSAHTSLAEIGSLLNEYGHPFSGLRMVLGLIVLVDCAVILCNRRKRAIHDFVAGSYVVNVGRIDDLGSRVNALKASYDALAEELAEEQGK